MTFFWILWSFNLLIALVALYFFIVGLTDGSVSDKNMGMWLLILAGLAGIIMGSFTLMRYNLLEAAKTILTLLALPGALCILMIIPMMFIKNWR